MEKNELYNTTDDKFLGKDKELGLSLKAYEIPQDTLCKAFQKAYNLFHPTKEQAQWWVDHKKEIDGIMCLNLKPEDSLCDYVDRELKKQNKKHIGEQNELKRNRGRTL